MENFTESLNKLREVHEKEVLGLQNKLLELNSERCRDAQRVEELFAKNQQLREQQKALKENLRVLENRLRAGLCDRCMVTQEVARKRQLEFESSHLQSLQRICVLTNELTRLKEENKMLKEEVKQLCSLERKAGTEKPQGGREEAEEDQPGTGPTGEEKSVGCRTSPVSKISPGGHLPEPRAPDMSPQRISNQLHATVALVRPGSRACLADHGPSDGTPPPSGSSPSSPGYEHSLPLDSFLRASGSSVPAYEPLTRPPQADRFCLLNRPLSLQLRSPHNGPQPWMLKAGEAWEEPAGLLGLPSALLGMQDPRLEGALHLLLAQRQLCARAHTQDYAPDKPLDLSDPGRSKDAAKSAGHTGSLSPKLAPSGSPEPLTLSRPRPRSPQTLSNGTQGATKLETEGLPTPVEPSQPLPETHLALLTAAGTRCEARRRSRPAPPPQSPQPATPPEPGQAGAQRPESEELDESDTSDSEVSPSSETGAKLSAPGEEHRCFCPRDPWQGLQQKRKQALDPESKASKKPCRGRRKVRELVLTAEGPDSPRDAKDFSPSPGNSGHEET